MTDSKVRLGVEVTDNGTSKKTADSILKAKAALFDLDQQAKKNRKSAKELRKSLDGLQDTVTKPVGGTSGSRKVAGLGETLHNQFDRARGAAQLSGAAARDFANQSRSLGGLVRLYATLAANIFAAGAAFSSLSTAADTSNMVSGLDQLGAAVGRNLGGLSKQVTELAGGAVSLAEAMRAVAQTSTGGLSAENIKRLTNVAKSASIALGVAMPDAINRLSRGITKLEPELLDELGIMTRLDPAINTYARAAGKSATQLTQFERRQAFANAVLAEGEEKFGAISGITVNPFSKLLSSIKDLTQSGLTFLNSFLVPVVDILSNSPTALLAGLSALGIGIVKQALPAIGEFKQGLRDAADSAAQLANARQEDLQGLQELINADKIRAKQQVENAKAAAAASVESLKQERASAAAKLGILRSRELDNGTVTSNILKKRFQDVTSDELIALEKRAKKLKEIGRIEEGNLLNRIRFASRKQFDAEDELAERNVQLQQATAAAAEKTKVAIINETLAKKANETATKKAIISNAAYNAGLVGISGASKVMKAEIAASNLQMNALNATLLRARGTAAIVGGAFSTVASGLVSTVTSLTNVVATVALVTTGLAALVTLGSSNEKQSKKFSAALDDLNSSLSNVDRTLDHINNKSLTGTISGIKAAATAFEDLTQNIEKAVNTAQDKLSNGNVIDSTVDSFLAIFGEDTQSDLTKGLTDSIEASIKTLDSAGLGKAAREKFAEILDSPDLSNSGIETSLNRLSTSERSNLVKALREESLVLSNVASRLQSFESATEAANLEYAKFIQTTSNNNPVFRVGAALQNLGSEMFKIVDSTELVQDQIKAVVQQLEKAPESAIVFGQDFVNDLVKSNKELEKTNVAIKKEQEALASLEKQLAKTSITDIVDESGNILNASAAALGIGESALVVLERNIQLQKEKIKAELAKSSNDASVLFTEGMQSAFEKGAELMAVSLGQASERAGLTIAKASLQGLSGENRAKKQNEIALKEIEIRLRAIDTNIELIFAQERLAAVIEEDTAQRALEAAKKGRDLGEIRSRERDLSVAKAFKDIVLKNIVPTRDNLSANGLSEDIANRVLIRGAGLIQRSQTQEQSRILAEADRDALGISGSINIRKGKLQDLERELNLENQINQITSQRINAVQQIVRLKDRQSVLDTQLVSLDKLKLDQSVELAKIDTEIQNAQSANEKAKLNNLRASILEKQEIQLINEQLRIGNELLTVRFNEISREAETIKAEREALLLSDEQSLAFRQAEADAYNNLLDASESFRASQAESFAIEAANLKFAREEAQANLDLAIAREEVEARISNLDPVKDSQGIELANKELKRRENLIAVSLLGARKVLDTELKIAKATKLAAKEQSKYNRILKNTDSVADKLSKAFGGFGKSVGNLSKAFSTFFISLEKSDGNISRIVEKQKGLNTNSKEYKELQSELALESERNAIIQLDGIASVASASKSFFDERSKAYRVLQAIEQTFTIFSIALSAQRTLADVTATQVNAQESAKRTAIKVAEAEVDGVAAVIKSIASLPFPANLAAGAAVAAVIASLIASIGGKDKTGNVRTGQTAEDVQEVQGTALTFRGSQIVKRGGGVLGDDREKVEDIANSLALIQDTTNVHSDFGRDTVRILEQIENNTRALTAQLIGSTDILNKDSAFGTVEGSSFKSLSQSGSTIGAIINPLGFVTDKIVGQIPVIGDIISGIFKSIFGTKKKIEIVDKGVIGEGILADLLELNTDSSFQEFETNKITKKKKAFGITVSKKTKFEEETRDLNRDANEAFIDLFSGLIEVSTNAAKVAFGSSNNAIQDALDTFRVDFKVSGFELSGEEFAEEILAESNVIINQLIESALPSLSSFRDIGEGFSATLLRVATQMSVTNQALGRFTLELNDLVGVAGSASIKSINSESINSSNLTKAINSIFTDGVTEQAINKVKTAEASLAESRNMLASELGSFAKPLSDQLNKAQSAFVDAKLAIADNKKATEELLVAERLLNGELKLSKDAKENSKAGVTRDVLELVDATKKLNAATKAAKDAFNNQGLAVLTFSDNLVKAFGGIEKFVEKTDFFFDNFFSDAEKLDAKTRELNASFNKLADGGIINAQDLANLTDGTGNLRLEFRQLISDMINLRGASAESINILADLAPAIVEVTDDLEDLKEELVGSDRILKNVKKELDEGFKELIEVALLGGLENSEIGDQVATLIKESVLTSLTSSVVDDLTKAITNNLVNPILDGVLTATTLSTSVINDTISTILQKTDAFLKVLEDPAINRALSKLTISVSKLVKGINDSSNSLTITFSRLNISSLTDQIKDLEGQIKDTEFNKLVDAEQSRLDLLREQKDALEDSSTKFRNFTDNLVDFRKSLLTDNKLSPFTPGEKLAIAREELNAIALNTKSSDPVVRDKAIERLENASSVFLDASRIYNASGEQFTQDFDFVQQILSNTISFTDKKASIDERQLDTTEALLKKAEDELKAVEESRDSLKSIDTELAIMRSQLVDLTDKLNQETAKGNTQITSGFTLLDTNLSGGLTFGELQSSGLASDSVLRDILKVLDKDNDGEISRVEAITGQGNKAVFTIDDVTDVLDATNKNSISFEQGKEQIRLLREANKLVDAPSVIGDIPRTGINDSFSIRDSELVRSSANIDNGVVTSITGQSLPLEEAKSQLQDLQSMVVSGEMTAKQVFDSLINFGATSHSVAQVLGVTSQDVIDFFKFFDDSIPAFSKGINSVPEDMFAKVHKNERILPAADNEELMAHISSKSQKEQEMLNQLVALNARIEHLEAALVLCTKDENIVKEIQSLKEQTKVNTEALAQVTVVTNDIASTRIEESAERQAVNSAWNNRLSTELT